MAFVEQDGLSFVEVIELNACASRHVEKHVLLTVVGLDEAEAFVRKSFDFAFTHIQSLLFFAMYRRQSSVVRASDGALVPHSGLRVQCYLKNRGTKCRKTEISAHSRPSQSRNRLVTAQSQWSGQFEFKNPRMTRNAQAAAPHRYEEGLFRQ